MSSQDRNSILIVDDVETNLIILSSILTPEYATFVAKNGMRAIELARKHTPDIILLDIVMPDIDGFEVLSRLKESEVTKNIPVILLTSMGNETSEEKGLELGAVDYIIKPFNPIIVKKRIKNQMEMINQFKEIKYLSITDKLTGLYNRHHFDERLEREWNNALRNKMVLSLLLIDLDHFKNYNDTYGHIQGDRALQETASLIEQSLNRSVDAAARWGGEEFAVLLTNTDLQGALKVAERIRERIEGALIFCSDGEITRITVSIGIKTMVPIHQNTIDEFLTSADKALYDAKERGRNIISIKGNADPFN